MLVSPQLTAVGLSALFVAAVGLQAAIVRQPQPGLPEGETGNLLYVQSPEAMRRMALSFDRLAGDLYWIRALQHFGGTRLMDPAERKYDLLWPLLDLATTLDPEFDIAFRYGAIFLAEEFPSGAGRPDQAIDLLEKGLELQPGEWRFMQDIGFVHYWWFQDYGTAAEIFQQAAEMEGAPNWMGALAAVVLAQGGNVESSRRLWLEMLETADVEWLRAQAVLRLRQLDAIDQMAALDQLSLEYERRSGALPQSWGDLIRAGLLGGVPVDPDGYPYVLNSFWGSASLSPQSTLNPLPTFDTSLAGP